MFGIVVPVVLDQLGSFSCSRDEESVQNFRFFVARVMFEDTIAFRIENRLLALERIRLFGFFISNLDKNENK